MKYLVSTRFVEVLLRIGIYLEPEGEGIVYFQFSSIESLRYMFFQFALSIDSW